MTTHALPHAGQPDGRKTGRSPGLYADPSRKAASAPIPAANGTASGLSRRAYLVLLMTPVFWMLLFVFAATVSRDSMWALPQPVSFLLGAAVLLAFSVPTVAVVVLAVMAWNRDRSWLPFPVTVALGLQVWAAVHVQSAVLLLMTVGIGLAVLLTAGVRQQYLKR